MMRNRATRRRGPITIGNPDWRQFSPDQWRCMTSRERWLIISAVIRGGKTRTGANATEHRIHLDYFNPRVNELALAEPIRYWVGAPTYRLNIPQKIYLVPKLKDSGLIDWAAQGRGTAGLNVTKGGGSIHLVNNRLIEFVSLDTPDSLVGATVRAGWISEIARCDEKAVDEFTGRMTNFADSWLVGDTSPYGRGWFYRRYIEPLMQGRYPDGELVQWSYESMLQWIDSPYFSGTPFLHRAEFEAKRLQLPDWMFRRDYLGLWENAEGQVYANFDPNRNVKTFDPAMKPLFERWVAADLNSTAENPACWLTLLFSRHTGEIHVEVEHSMYVGTESNRYAEALVQTVKACGAKGVILDPSITNAIKDKIAESRITVINGINAVDSGIRHVATLIGTGRLTVSPNCLGTLDEIAEYRWKVDRHGTTLPVPDKDKFDAHRLDALRYAAMTLRNQSRVR